MSSPSSPFICSSFLPMDFCLPLPASTFISRFITLYSCLSVLLILPYMAAQPVSSLATHLFLPGLYHFTLAKSSCRSHASSLLHFFTKTDIRFRCTAFRSGLATNFGCRGALEATTCPPYVLLQHRRRTLLRQHLPSHWATHSWINSTGGRAEQKASQFLTPYPSSPYAVIRRDTAISTFPGNYSLCE